MSVMVHIQYSHFISLRELFSFELMCRLQTSTVHECNESFVIEDAIYFLEGLGKMRCCAIVL